jgi:hypothetical protein
MAVEHTLLGTTDAMVWSREFCRIFNGKMIAADEMSAAPQGGPVTPGTMVAWFANAIELGRTTGRRELCPHKWVPLGNDLYSCRDCGSTTSEEPEALGELEAEEDDRFHVRESEKEAFVEGFREGRPQP